MCFQIPKQIKSINYDYAVVEGDMIVKTGNLKVATGDYVLVYGNMAVEKLEKKQALEMRKTINILDSLSSS